MKSVASFVQLLLSIVLLSACHDSSALLRIKFADELAKQTVEKLEMWVFSTDLVNCSDLQNDLVDPHQAGVPNILNVSFAYPPDQSSPDEIIVKAGRMTFFMEGLGDQEQLVVEGCTEVEVKKTGSFVVEIELGWVCKPSKEICDNNQDDDCDGLVDLEDEECQQICKTYKDCQDNNPCTYKLCVDERCQYSPIPDSTICSDNNPCTHTDQCKAGECIGEELDCHAFDGQCKIGVCDPILGECESVARDDGTECDDNSWCTVSDACVDGDCVGHARECNDDDTCTQDTCSEGEEQCNHERIPNPDAEGPMGDATCNNKIDDDCDGFTDVHDANCSICNSTNCDDRNPCTKDECQGLDCINTPVQDGRPCEDRKFCTIGDQCFGGVCQGVERPCTEGAVQCEVGFCNEAEAKCIFKDKADGTVCDDNRWCSTGDQCVSGECVGQEKTCDDQKACTVDSCDEINNHCVNQWQPIPDAEGPYGDENCSNDLDDDCDGEIDQSDTGCMFCETDQECNDYNPCTLDYCMETVCQHEVLTDNTECDDGLLCTDQDVCVQGKCLGSPINCSHLDHGCQEGRCDEKTGQCIAEKRAEGVPCDDSLWCTHSDRCFDGVCLGSQRICDDSNICTEDSCSEDQGKCLHLPINREEKEGVAGHSDCSNNLDDDCDGLTDLEDNDCYVCSLEQECENDEPCVTYQCVEGLCVAQPHADGDACEDGLWCTIDDVCQDGTCVGQERDCIDVTQACHSFRCNEQAQTCEASPLPDTTSCDDGEFCTVDDRCVSGQCMGNPKDCGHLDDTCIEGVCDDDLNSCIPENLEQGTPCQDGLFCTTDDSCQDGKCLGDPIDCNDNDDCTVDACDEVNNRCSKVLNPRPGEEGGPQDSTCSNSLDDDCDGATDLDDGDCTDCTRNKQCEDSNPCTKNLCMEGLCTFPPVDNGSICDDTQYCSVNDHCHAGVCTGDLRDCSTDTQPCYDGVCNEEIDQCELQQKEDGTVCSDDNWCTVGDHCQAGECISSLRDCNDDDACTSDGCNELAEVCENIPTDQPIELDICGDTLDQDCDGVLDSCCLTEGGYSLISSPATGTQPWYITTADVNEDGVNDLITINRSDNNFSVLLGNGANGRADGSFAASVIYPVESGPFHLVIDDLNDDDLKDIAVANQNSNSVTVYFGQGTDGHPDGSFGDRMEIGLGELIGPVQVLALDVTTDGINDLVTANLKDNSIAVLVGHGTDGQANGTFAEPVFYSLSSEKVSPRTMCAGDFDADGILDLALGNTVGGKIRLMKGGGSSGRGDGSFRPMGEYAAGNNQMGIFAPDFNTDGILDLVVLSMNEINVYLGNGIDGRGNGTFGNHTKYENSSTSVAAAMADLNADGISDIVVSQWTEDSASVLLGNGSDGRGDGTFGARSSFEIGQFPSSITLADHSGDGLLDIVSCNYGDNSVSLLAASGSGGIGDGGFVVAGAVDVGASPRSFAIADVNADSLADLLVTHEEEGSFASILGLGSNGRANGTFETGAVITTCTEPGSIVTADINADKIPDVLVACKDSGVFSYLGDGSNAQGTGTYTSLQAITTGQNPAMVATQDLNADTILDLVLLDSDSLKVYLGEGNNGWPTGVFESPAEFDSGSNPTAFALGDLNADNVTDIAIANPNWITIKLGEGSGGRGTGDFGPSTTFAMGVGPVHVILIDIDKDGILDLISANSESNDISLRLGNGASGRGDGTFGEQQTIAVGQKPVMVAAHDLDRDNDLDLVVVNQDSASLSIVLGTGLGTFNQAAHTEIGGRPRAVKIAHVDWDGRLDLLVLDQQGNKIKILRQTGSCTQQLE